MGSYPFRRPTLAEVARLAGVSRSTASRVLSGSPATTPETKKRVRLAAKQLGYKTNHAARSLRTDRTMLIGLVLNNIYNTTFQTTAEVAQRELAEQGYQTVLCVTGGDPGAEREFLDTLTGQRVDGVLIAGSGENSDKLREMADDGISVVSLIRSPSGPPGDVVLANDIGGADMAVSHLLSRGHNEIAYIGGPTTTTSGRERLQGYEEAIRKAGAYNPEFVEIGPFTPGFGAEAIERIYSLTPRPTAIYLANHEASLGVMQVLADKEIEIPRDLSIIAHERAAWFPYWRPAITHIDNRPQEIATLAVQRLLADLLDPAQRRSDVYRVEPELVLRSST